ncbi:hypothetical protein JKP76_00190 [Blastococcus sp. TML/C7B]|nr:hypothetical protein [Blastococcus sp. TML/C7B]MBN1094616.1 hypothetical protein [Blastococcus sp. TML/C7B]
MEGVEVGAVALLAEAELHWAPVPLIQLGLVLRLQPHEHVVANQVGLAELAAGRVHTLEDELRVVLSAIERDVDDDQLGQPAAERRQVALESRDLLVEQLEVLRDAQRAPLRQRPLLDERRQAVPVGLRQQQLEGLVAVLERVEQVVAAQLPGREALHRLVVAEVPRQRLEQQRHGR